MDSRFWLGLMMEMKKFGRREKRGIGLGLRKRGLVRCC